MVLRLKCDKEALKKAAQVIKQGGLVVYPTDTVYGLGCNPFDLKAVKRIYELKKRSNKPLPILCSSIDHVKELVNLRDLGLRLAARYWPGPLTIVAEIKSNVLPIPFIRRLRSLGVRIPNHQAALRLIELSGGKLVGTSANRSGSKPPTTADEVLNTLGSEFDILLDGGPTPLQKESTVVDTISGKLRILREGALKLSEASAGLNEGKA